MNSMKWEELIAEARSAGVLAFCSDGIAVLKRSDAETSQSAPPASGEDRSERRESRQGQSEGS